MSSIALAITSASRGVAASTLDGLLLGAGDAVIGVNPATDSVAAPWIVINSNDKRRARLNCMRHLLSKVPYEDMTPAAIELAPRKGSGDYQRPPINEQFFVPNHYR
jgi:hypothetical protein